MRELDSPQWRNFILTARIQFHLKDRHGCHAALDRAYDELHQANAAKAHVDILDKSILDFLDGTAKSNHGIESLLEQYQVTNLRVLLRMPVAEIRRMCQNKQVLLGMLLRLRDTHRNHLRDEA